MQCRTVLAVWVVMAGLLLGLWGCGNGGVGGANATIVQGTIGNAGGVVSDGNLTLSVPSSALTQSTVFSVQQTPASQYPANNTLVPGTAFTIASTATTLNAAVTVAIRYNAATIPNGVQEVNLQLYQVVSGVWTLVTGSVIDTNNKVVTATTTTLGVFGVLSTVASTASTTTTGGTTTAGGTTTGGTTTGSKTTNLLFQSDSGSSTVITSTGTQTVTQLGLYYTTLGGTSTQTIATPGIPAEQIAHASFSPDAKTVVYDSLNAAAPLIALSNTTGASSQILVQGGVSSTGGATTPRAPSFSADGKKIVFVYNQTGTDQIYTMNPDGTSLTQITRNFTGANVDLPAFTKAGSIAFISTTAAGLAQYNLVSATGGTVSAVSAFGPTVAPWYTYSPDGTKIVYVAQTNSRSDVYLINADGSSVTRLTTLGASAVGNARFSADGTKVIFDAATTATALRAVYTVSLTGTGLQTLAVSTGSSANNFLADAR